MFLRRNNKIRSEVSFDEPLNIDWDGIKLFLLMFSGTENDTIYRDIEDQVDKQVLRMALGMLSNREQKIVILRIGLAGGEEKTKRMWPICWGSLNPIFPG